MASDCLQRLRTEREEGCRIISDHTGLNTDDNSSGLFLLFHHSARVTAVEVLDIIKDVAGLSASHVPTSSDDSPAEWLEVTIDGMTFDITGLAPGNPVSSPSFTRTNEFEDLPKIEDLAAISIAVGPHLKGGTYLLPVARGLLRLGSELGARLPGLLAYLWPASGNPVQPDMFRGTVDRWNDGGAFPAAVLTRFNDTMDGGLQSKGLSAFTGQELRIEPDLAANRDMAIRLGDRLINQLVLSGKVAAVEEVTGPDGNRLRLEPSKNGRFVRVWRC